MDALVSLPTVDAECPDDDAFVALFERTLVPEKAALLEAHIDACPQCRRLVGTLGRMHSLSPASDSEDPRRPSPGTIARGTCVGRYVVLSLLGAGSMGVVFSAYDPELDRRVALKLLRADVEENPDGSTRARLVREAQTIARVASPNVIAVYDVGEFDGRVFLAMEFASGSTLTDWLDAKARDWREILPVFIAAGRGLASAHSVGVVHRDFKPDNVLITRSGQVKVADFGLARPDPAGHEESVDLLDGLAPARLAAPATVTQTGARIGTPAYMAPEQHRGLRADARSDQFSFSVALYEGLVGNRPPRTDSHETADASSLEDALRRRVPAWLAAAVARGLRNDASTRHSSMEEFLRVLEGTPRRNARRAVAVIVAVGVLVVATTTTVLARMRPHGQSLLCSGSAERVAAVWDGERKHAIERAFDKTGLPYARFASRRVGEIIDAYTRDWAASRTDACMATRARGEQSEAMLDLRMACLDRHLEGVGSLREILERGTPGVVENATRTALALSPLSDCASERIEGTAGAKDEEGIRKAHPDIAGKIERAKLLGRSGAFAESDGLAEAARDEARRASVPSLEAAALVKLGRNKVGLQNWEAAAQLDFDAFEAAERSGATATAAEAAVDVAFSETKLNKTDDVQRWLRVASALLERMGGDRPMEVSVAQVRANALLSSGHYEEALEASRKALAIAESPSVTDPVGFAAVLNTYGVALAQMNDSAGRDAAYERALEIFERELGPDHPTTGIIVSNLALGKLDEERYEEALGFARRALSISEKLGPDYPSQSKDRAAVGRALMGLRRYDEARPYLERALALAEQNPTAEKREVAYRYASMGQLEDRTNHDAEAERAYGRAIALFEEALGKGRPQAADATLGLGLLRLKEGRPRAAADELEISLAESGRGGDVAPVTRLALARALWETGGDRVRARALAQQAIDYFARHPAKESGARDLEQWLQAHGVLASR